MRLRSKLLIAGVLVAGFMAPALADLNYTQGSGTVVFDFICFTTKHCPAHVNTNSAGTEIMTSSNPAQVTGANGTFPATQSGTWTVQPGNTANTTAWLVTGTGGTFPVTQATAANLNATVVPSTLAAWGLTASAQNGATPTNAQLAMGQFNTTPTTITSGNVSPLQMDASGNLLVNIKAGAGSGGTAITDNSAFTQGTTSETPMGCLFNSSYAAATSGRSTVVSCTNGGSMNVNVTNANANGAAAAANSSPVTPSNQPVAAASLATGQVSVTTTATSIVAARTGVSGTGAISRTICNTGTTAVFLGNSGVTTSTGQYLAGVAGACATLNFQGQIFGIVASGTQTVAFSETF